MKEFNAKIVEKYGYKELIVKDSLRNGKNYHPL